MCAPAPKLLGRSGFERGRRDEDKVMLCGGGKGRDNFWWRVGAPAEVAAGEREGRETPKSENGREEDEKFFGPMGREGKIFWGRKLERARWLAWGELRGKDDVG